jgi:hypothetical protein
MEYNMNNMCDWERQKAVFLLSEAEKLGMNTSEYGMLDVNPNSGYTYLWLEEYNFALYMPIDCELDKSEIMALWTNPEDGEELKLHLNNSTTLNRLENWANELSEQAEVK